MKRELIVATCVGFALSDVLAIQRWLTVEPTPHPISSLRKTSLRKTLRVPMHRSAACDLSKPFTVSP